jgi:hypothetical protein
MFNLLGSIATCSRRETSESKRTPHSYGVHTKRSKGYIVGLGQFFIRIPSYQYVERPDLQ